MALLLVTLGCPLKRTVPAHSAGWPFTDCNRRILEPITRKLMADSDTVICSPLSPSHSPNRTQPHQKVFGSSLYPQVHIGFLEKIY